ncbi:MAG: amidohydrolase family protein [Bryobacteraceae bacterium]
MKCSGKNALTGEWITVDSGAGVAIQMVDPVLEPRDTSAVVDYVSPGFIDLQVNGFAGVDFNSPNAPHADIERATRAILSTGVTRFLPTIITGDPGKMLAALRNLAVARETIDWGEAIEGFHVEGPHISVEDGPRGAHPKQWVRPPDAEEFLRWYDAAEGNIRIVTLAPEWPGACAYIEAVTREGVVASIGHTRATAQQIRDAVSAGATMCTHLGNGAGSKTRTEEFITAQFDEPRLAASFIVDDHHLPDDFLMRALDAKGLDRSVLVTDAVAPAMCPPGDYLLGGVEVHLHEGDRVTLRGGTRLAGSALRMDHAIGNVMRRARLNLAQAVLMATTNAARVGRIRGRLRGLQPGERADVVKFRVFGGQVVVSEVYLGGARVG